MTGTLELTARIDHPPRERPFARTPVARYRLARHRCRGARVIFRLWELSVYFLLQKLLYVVYYRNTTLNDGQSRRVNQQSPRCLGTRCGYWRSGCGLYRYCNIPLGQIYYLLPRMSSTIPPGSLSICVIPPPGARDLRGGEGLPPHGEAPCGGSSPGLCIRMENAPC